VSLSILSPLPDPLKRVHQLQQEIDDLRNQLEDAQDDLRKERQKTATMERWVSRLREALTPVYSGLQMIFGEIEATGVQGEMASASGLDPRKAAVWEDWKRKMPGIPARFIDALMLHGELSQTQLRLHAKCAQGSVAGVVSQLWKAGLINKNGGKISLKQL